MSTTSHSSSTRPSISYLSPPRQDISLPTATAAILKMHLINIGMQALQAGDDVMVQRITELLRERGLHHV